mmetsp:Transcript_56230/g.131800  ORF Transcript_56230/g.131800 Transcript_56230/m.131800 type:complete len:282 (+) Transcript_56230:1665-2510(+)
MDSMILFRTRREVQSILGACRVRVQQDVRNLQAEQALCIRLPKGIPGLLELPHSFHELGLSSFHDEVLLVLLQPRCRGCQPLSRVAACQQGELRLCFLKLVFQSADFLQRQLVLLNGEVMSAGSSSFDVGIDGQVLRCFNRIQFRLHFRDGDWFGLWRHLCAEHTNQRTVLLNARGQKTGKSAIARPIGLPVDDIDLVWLPHRSLEGLAEARVFPLASAIGKKVRCVVELFVDRINQVPAEVEKEDVVVISSIKNVPVDRVILFVRLVVVFWSFGIVEVIL